MFLFDSVSEQVFHFEPIKSGTAEPNREHSDELYQFVLFLFRTILSRSPQVGSVLFSVDDGGMAASVSAVSISRWDVKIVLI